MISWVIKVRIYRWIFACTYRCVSEHTFMGPVVISIISFLFLLGLKVTDRLLFYGNYLGILPYVKSFFFLVLYLCTILYLLEVL